MNKLRRNLITAFALSVIFPVTIVGLLTFTEARKQNREAFVNSISGEIRQIDSTFSLFFKQIEDNLHYLSELDIIEESIDTIPTFLHISDPYNMDPTKFNESTEKLFNTFGKFATTHSDLAYIYLGNERSGYLQWPAGPIPESYDPRVRPWYQSGFSAAGKIVRSDAYYWAPDNTTIISTIRRINNNMGTPQGVIGMDVSLKGLTALVSNIKYGQSGYLMLVEQNLNVLVDARVPGNTFKPLSKIEGGSFALLANKTDGSYEIHIHGKAYLATLFTSPQLGWRFIGLIEQSEVDASSNNLMRITLTIVMISLAIFLAASVMFSTSISGAIAKRQQLLIEARQQAEQANEAKSNFLSTISHEIRTPLNGILGMAQIVADTDLNAEQDAQIKTILTSGNTLLSIINDVLDMSKIEADALELEETTFSLKNIISGTMTPFAMTAKDKGIHLLADPPPPGLDMMVGDPVRLRQILWNLVSNAIKFTGKGCVTVSFNLLPNDGEDNLIKLELTVKDTGVGISQQRLTGIFQPFAQEDSSITRKYGGTGLGLAIVKRIIDLMGGTITAESTLGEGTKFSVHLTFRHPEKEEIASLLARKEAIEQVVAKNLKILIAEDNPINAVIAKRFLEKFGCAVKTAENGQLAIDEYKSYNPDLIFMDVHMPVLDGIAATKTIRSIEMNRHVPIIGLTADVFTDHHQSFIKAGMDDVITKPFTEKQLKATIIRYAKAEKVSASSQEIDTLLHEIKVEGKSTPPSNLNIESAKHKTQSLPLKKHKTEQSSSFENQLSKFDSLPIGDTEQLTRIQKTLGTETLHSLMEMAPTNINDLYTALERSVAENNAETARKSLHTIKGSVSSLCAIRLTEMTKFLEGHSSNLDQISLALPLYFETIEETKSWWAQQI